MGNNTGAITCSDPNCVNKHHLVQTRLIVFKSGDQWYRLLINPQILDNSFVEHVKGHLLNRLQNSSEQLVDEFFVYGETSVKFELAKIEAHEVAKFAEDGNPNNLFSD